MFARSPPQHKHKINQLASPLPRAAVVPEAVSSAPPSGTKPPRRFGAGRIYPDRFLPMTPSPQSFGLTESSAPTNSRWRQHSGARAARCSKRGTSQRSGLVIFRYVNGEPRESVTAVTAVGDGWCSTKCRKNIQMYDNFSSAIPIDDRNERPLLVALIAIVAAWSIVFLLGL